MNLEDRVTDEDLAEFRSLCDVDGEGEALKQLRYGFATRLAAEVAALRAERLAAVAWLRARAAATEDEDDAATADDMEKWIAAGCPEVTT